MANIDNLLAMVANVASAQIRDLKSWDFRAAWPNIDDKRVIPMRLHKKRLGAEIAAFIALSTCAATSQAQMLEEIVVTAQKRAQSVQDIPIAISAMSAEMINDTGVDNISQVLPMLPGVSGSTAGISTNAWAIRGISTNDWSIGSEPSVAIYIDEAYVGRNNLATGAFFDLERIEAANGPQGTLFGRNASAGAIIMTTNKPSDENSLRLGVGAGDEGQEEYDIVANGAVSDSAAVRFAYHGSRIDGDGIWEDVANDKDAYREEDNFRLAGRWDITESFEALLTLNYGKQKTNMNGGYSPFLSTVEPGEEFPDEIAMSIPDREENKTSGADLRLTWQFDNGMTLTSITDARKYEYEYRQDLDGSNADALLDAVLAIGTGGVTLEFANEDTEGDTISQEFRLNGSTDALDWFVGVNYFDENVKETQQLNLIDTALGLGLLARDQNKNKGDNTSLGIYGDVRWNATDALGLTVGGRWTQDEKDWCTTGSADLYFVSLPTAGKVCDDEEWTEFTPRGVIDYTINDDLMVYGSVTRGYKAGGFNPATSDANGDFIGDTVVSFDPEKNTSYEIGAKTEFLDGKMRLNAAAYFSDYEDLQVATATLGGIFIGNAAKAEIKGVELDWTYVPTASWTLNANYSYIDSEYTKGVLKDNDLNYAPENSYAVSTKYDMAIGEGVLAWFAMYTYQDDFYFDPGNSLGEDGYGLLSANLTYTPPSESWDVGIRGENLTDEDYANIRSDIGLGTGPSINRGLPRLWKVSFNVYF